MQHLIALFNVFFRTGGYTEIVMTEENKIETSEMLEKLRKVLTTNEMKFADNIMMGMSPLDAYNDAGLKDYHSDTENRKYANALNRAPKLRAYIDEIQRICARRSIMTLEAIDQRVTDIAMTNISDIVTIGDMVFPTGPGGSESAPIQMVTIKDMNELTEAQRASIASIKPVSGGLEVKLIDRLKALEFLAKRQNGFKETHEVTHSGKVETFAYLGDNGRGPKD